MRRSFYEFLARAHVVAAVVVPVSFFIDILYTQLAVVLWLPVVVVVAAAAAVVVVVGTRAATCWGIQFFFLHFWNILLRMSNNSALDVLQQCTRTFKIPTSMFAREHFGHTLRHICH